MIVTETPGSGKKSGRPPIRDYIIYEKPLMIKYAVKNSDLSISPKVWIFDNPTHPFLLLLIVLAILVLSHLVTILVLLITCGGTNGTDISNVHDMLGPASSQIGP